MAWSSLSIPGQSFIISREGRGREDRIWTHGDSYTSTYESIWPLPVDASQCQQVPDSKRLRRLKADIASWPYAALKVDVDALDALYEGMVSDRLDVVALVTGYGGVYALLRVNGVDYSSWRESCQECAKTLQQLGMVKPEFRLDTLLPIPSRHHKLVYLA